MSTLKFLIALLATTFLLLGSAFAQTNAATPSTVTIRSQANYLTMMNVFTPTEGTQDDVIAAVNKGLDEQVSKLPGFINATVHRSLDNDYVVVYAQWRDRAAVDEAIKVIQAGGAPDMMRAFTLASPELHPYQVVSIHTNKEGLPE